MKKIIKKVMILALAAGMSSCSDWLAETNPNQLDSQSYWTNLSETESTLISTYSTLLSHSVTNVREEAWRSDMATPGFGRPSYTGDGVVWYSQIYGNSNQYIVQKWESLYLGVFRANQTIQGLEKVKDLDPDVDMEEWTKQMAEARFLRGLFYFYLHSDFNKGEVIIRDKVPANLDEYYGSISSSEDVINFFRADLQYAYENLPVENDASTHEMGRVTKGTAATILGTSYLYQDEIEQATEMFEDVVFKRTASYPYELVQDTLLLFTNEGEMNKESILEIAYNTTHRAEYSTWVEDRMTNRWAGYSISNTYGQGFFPPNWITWAYLNEEIDTKDPRNVARLNDDGTPDFRNVSLRASAMIGLVQDEEAPYYGTTFGDKTPTNERAGCARYKHFTNHTTLTDENDLEGGRYRSGKNVILNRLGDVYLMLAECYIYQDRVAEAIDIINDVRGRWGLKRIGLSNGDVNHDYDEVVYTKESLLTRLQTVEKPLETSVEGHSIRWNDLRRWGMIKSNFEKLAAQDWWTAHYQYESNAKWKWNGTITDTDPDNDKQAHMKDYEQAALNFNYDLHAWLPIPSTEVANNPGLYGNK